MVATCNYVAREFGIHSAMPSATARRRCANLIIIRPDMEKYRRISRQVHGIFRRYTEIIEPLSLDEAYLDVAACKAFGGDAVRIAEAIRAAVRGEIGITISAGIAPNKLLAKIASDYNKPDGQFVVAADQVAGFIAQLPVARLHGVGKVTAAKLSRLGIGTCGELQALSLEDLRDRFGRFGPAPLRAMPRHRQAAGRSGPHPQIGQRGNDLPPRTCPTWGPVSRNCRY